MLRTSTSQPSQNQDPEQGQNTAQSMAKERRRTILVLALVVIETLLVMSALVPAQFWTRFPRLSHQLLRFYSISFPQ